MAETGDGWTDGERQAEIARVEAHMTVEEIFEQGYKFGHARAGFQSHHDSAFVDCLDGRLEKRVRVGR